MLMSAVEGVNNKHISLNWEIEIEHNTKFYNWFYLNITGMDCSMKTYAWT